MYKIGIGWIEKKKQRYFGLSLSLFFSFLLLGCLPIKKEKATPSFTHLQIEENFHCPCSIRALDVDENAVFFAGSNGYFGYLNPQDLRVRFMDRVENGQLEFRSLSRTTEKALILSVDNPAYLFEVDSLGTQQLIFKQDKKGSFFDAMIFWNDQEGLMVGDPIQDCMAIYITRNAGISWLPVDCEQLPKAVKGEAAFAASNSNIAIQGDSTWILSGGAVSRVYFSPDKGKTWEVFSTPFIKGKNTTGGYSIDFYNAKIGIAVGGDYTATSNDKANKIRTQDGGKTWEIIADGSPPGYQSSVKFVPNKKGRELISVGTTGIFYSFDRGDNWSKLSDQSFHAIAFLNDSIAFASGEGKIAKLTFH